jgi:hypothetical protein
MYASATYRENFETDTLPGHSGLQPGVRLPNLHQSKRNTGTA